MIERIAARQMNFTELVTWGGPGILGQPVSIALHAGRRGRLTEG